MNEQITQRGGISVDEQLRSALLSQLVELDGRMIRVLEDVILDISATKDGILPTVFARLQDIRNQKDILREKLNGIGQ